MFQQRIRTQIHKNPTSVVDLVLNGGGTIGPCVKDEHVKELHGEKEPEQSKQEERSTDIKGYTALVSILLRK